MPNSDAAPPASQGERGGFFSCHNPMFKRKYIAIHGAVYGSNFGDVLIQLYFAHALEQSTGLAAWFPMATRRFNDQAKTTIGRRHRALQARFGAYGPGGYFGERPFRLDAWHERLIQKHGRFDRLMRLSRTPIVTFGVGIGPLSRPESRAFVASVLDRSRFIGVRDAPSRDYAIAFGIAKERINIYPDIAFLVECSHVPADASERTLQRLKQHQRDRVVGLHLQNITGETNEGYDRVLEELKHIVPSNPDVLFVLLSDVLGWRPCEALSATVEKNSNLIVAPFTGPWELLALLSHLDIVVTTKLHVGICSTVLGAVPISMYFHDKVVRFFEDIDCEDACTAISRYQNGWLEAQLRRALEGNRRPLRALCEKNRELVRKGIDDLSRSVADLA